MKFLLTILCICHRDGSRPVIDFTAHKKLMYHQTTGSPESTLPPNLGTANASNPNNRGYYPGLPGLLHSGNVREVPSASLLGEYLGELSLSHLQSLAFMFNFQGENVFLGANRICMQLDDSEWSTAFSLDNLEINQV